jgi:hypothetical protein
MNILHKRKEYSSRLVYKKFKKITHIQCILLKKTNAAGRFSVESFQVNFNANELFTGA